jgi:acyl-CoA synthetase (AMP-forming)/AMP-acid ligase II
MFAIPSTVVTVPKWDTALVLRLIPRLKITVLPLVPSMILQLVTHPEWEKTDTSTVEHTASGAAFLPPEIRTKLLSKIESNLTHGYGSSESVRGPP